MSDFETWVATMLHDVVEEPRRQLDPEDVFASRPVRRRNFVLVASAAAVVVAITVALTLFHTRGNDVAGPSPQPTGSSVSGSASAPATRNHEPELYGRTWVIDRIQGQAGAAASTPAKAAMRLVFTRPTSVDDLSSITIGTCTNATAHINADHVSFVQGFITSTQTGCASDLSTTQARVVFGVLRGHVTWNVSGHKLTITGPGGGSLEFTDAGPNGTVQMTLHLDQTTAPANGQPITGYVTVYNETGRPVTISDACDGWIGVGLTNSHASYDFSDGLVLCASDYLPEGTSRTPIMVQTIYQGCIPGAEKDSREIGTPPCIGANHPDIPPLPPGRYVTKVEIRSLTPTIAAPAKAEVTLTKP